MYFKKCTLKKKNSLKGSILLVINVYKMQKSGLSQVISKRPRQLKIDLEMDIL